MSDENEKYFQKEDAIRKQFEERYKYKFDTTFPKELAERFKRMDADTGPKMSAGHGPQSWRDKVRGLALDKFGRTGKHFAESMIGMSEEDKVQRYLDRTYGYANAPYDSDIDLTSRPFSDMLRHGISDFGLLDTALTAMTLGAGALPRGVGTAAALTESAALAGDAVGEYKKGNTLGAGIMGALVGAPPLLRYFVGKTPPPKGQMELQLKPREEIDLKRRKFTQGLGIGLGAAGILAMAPGATMRKVLAPAKVAGKAVANIPNVSSRFYVMRALKDALGDIDYTKGILGEMERLGGLNHKEALNRVFNVPKENVDRIIIEGGTNPDFLARFKNVPGYQTADDWINMKYEYELFDTFDDLARLDKQVSFEEFNKVFDAKAAEMKMPFKAKTQAEVRDMLSNQADLYIWNSPEFRKAAFKQYKVLETIADDPASFGAKELDAISKRMQEVYPKGHFDSESGKGASEIYENYTDELSKEYSSLSNKAQQQANKLMDNPEKYGIDYLDDMMKIMEESDLKILHESPLP
tara:strand:+ start:2046 stop:3617 length:1572 start_codon:yes stop_codon:yes gene_type:complete